MNRALPGMLHCLNMAGNLTDISILDKQRARMMWQKEQQESYFNNGNEFGMTSLATGVSQAQPFLGVESGLRQAKPDPGMENGLSDFVNFTLTKGGSFEPSCGSGFELNYAISRTNSSSLPEMASVMLTDGKESVSGLTEKKLSVGVGGESFKKRKADKLQNSKVVAEDHAKDKRIKGCAGDGESKITQQNDSKNETINKGETSADTSKENSKVTEVPKPDYIHVRARRGQATDSHSLAERVRREKISERMKYLQDLVPGCNKITGKAGMLDEIINYVQSLQRQVEFLSMKLAAVNPRLDFDIENAFEKEVFPTCTSSYPTVGVSSEMSNPAYLEFNPVQQGVTFCGLELGINPLDMGLRRTISAPVSVPETFLDTSCFNQMQPPATWDADLQNLLSMEFHQGRSTFPSQAFTGSVEASNLKIEM